MAKGYPGRKRARKAFWRGVKSARRKTAFNPYGHPRLKELFDRGRLQAQLTPALLLRVPVKPPRRISGNRAERSTRSASGRSPHQRNPRRFPF